MKRLLTLTLMFMTLIMSSPTMAQVEEYQIDVKGAHAFVQFRIKHLGYSWLYGRFNKFEGDFTIDRENLANSTIEVTIDTASLDSNHAKRDKHLRAEKYLDVANYPEAKFVSTSLKVNADQKSGILTGNLTLKGVTKSVGLDVKLIGEGKDPWGGYRAGFEGSTTLTLADFNIKDFAPTVTKLEMILAIEGRRKHY
ncbi:MAG: YceI family protein [Rickettsiales bacterium]|jgi:polyisoprenoid-binding protein YceI|nr:YceI family protein [Rickettsiales bacterium]